VCLQCLQGKELAGHWEVEEEDMASLHRLVAIVRPGQIYQSSQYHHVLYNGILPEYLAMLKNLKNAPGSSKRYQLYADEY
jgi:hypothetical protein